MNIPARDKHLYDYDLPSASDDMFDANDYMPDVINYDLLLENASEEIKDEFEGVIYYLGLDLYELTEEVKEIVIDEIESGREAYVNTTCEEILIEKCNDLSSQGVEFPNVVIESTQHEIFLAIFGVELIKNPYSLNHLFN